MGGHWTDEFSFRTGAVRHRDLAYLLVAHDDTEEEELPFTGVVTRVRGQWFQKVFEWTAKSACVCSYPKEQLVAIGPDGDFLVFGQGEVLEGKIVARPEDEEKQGHFTRVQSICGKAHVVGMRRQVYRRDGREQWTKIDNGLPVGGEQTVGLTDIHGIREDEIYSVGWKGEIWCYDAAKWSPIDSPTNLILTAVRCGDDENVYACGRAGMLLRGNRNRWEVIEHGGRSQDFWDLEWFEGKLYVASMSFLYTLEGDTLKLVDFGEDSPSTCFHLSSADGVLWSIGQKDVMAFDGKSWTRID